MGRAGEDDYDYLEDEGRHSIAMVIGGIVLLIIIIILCIMIWKLSHKDQDQGAGQQNGQQESVEDTLAAESMPSGESGAQPDLSSGQEDGDQDGAPASSGQPDGSLQEPSQPNGSSLNDSQGQEDSGTVTMTFQDVDETVTAKELTNLRSEPSTARDDTVVVQLKNGQTAKRTGINKEAGWSRLEYEGQVLYAASSLLTTDLTVKGNASDKQEGSGQQSGSNGQSSGSTNTDASQNPSGGTTDPNTVTTSTGRTITFTPCDDTVSPKIEANLRGEPSTDQENASIHHRLAYGETVHRTGYDEDSGWSRVEYNGEVLYVVTSLIYVVEDQAE